MEKYDGPAYNEMMPQLFETLKELGGSGTVDEIDQKTIKLLNLREETTDFPHNGSNKTEVEYRLAWTRTYMKKAGILENSVRGHSQLKAVDYKL